MNSPIRNTAGVSEPLNYPLTTDSAEFQSILDEIGKGAAARDLTRTHPFEAVAALKQAKIGAIRLPVEVGGGGITFREFYRTVLRLGAVDSNVAHLLRNHFVFAERYLQSPDDDQLRAWQRIVADGAIVGAAVQDIERVQGAEGSFSTLEAEGTGFRLNGTKAYSTGCLYSDYILVRIKRPDGAQASIFIPSDREGITLEDDWDGSGQRLTGTGTTRLVNVRVDEHEVVFDRPGMAYNLPYSSTLPQLYMTAINAGIMRNVLEEAKALVHRRVRSFHHASSARPDEDPSLHQVIGQIASNAFAGESVVLAAAEVQDTIAALRAAGNLQTEEAGRGALLAAQAKIIVDELTLRAATALYDVGGASATRQGPNLDRHWRNARTLASHNPAIYKARAVGEYEVNGTPLPKADFF
ncbi:Uncharacterized protein ALO70_04473 [Pseudomonas amygdali pv. eriobotryae]|uniref:Acyl-CoA dehydrogenase n=1 Tax=Pseudomonas amygdali pv. eriobotryae TaxID=129137 RepID=A0A0N8REK4_PSEA0|nr:acyl-CoA dehydrogenase [Pseudomonas amygdali]KPX20639.1 Uncharacterized protein ALO70_04473 [Pseudomonas amygdali pv. eriobotryae]KWS78390.1 acyl-CoA dehydrogenase [Pseudomonas amygdali pv. eriobotryae]RMM02417.1 hypothetical protein ALQ86_03708 [Pseudomonas amygdali pv. eriobotryae]GFZ62745.1 acyl-CoA dehydrogenase [Pseudomonas amygdali pv. eriobotryae]GFZ73891.1 acyl-CoA dehydrogenase [Pseudomonas amygdali pv. eriobotryae]